MNKLKLWLLLLTLVCFLPSNSLAISVNDGVYTNTSSVNVRSSPSLSGGVVATLPVNTTGIVIGGPSGPTDGYIWYQVLWAYGSPTTTGWSAQDYMSTYAPQNTLYDDNQHPGWHNLAWTNMSSNYFSSTKRTGTYGIQATASAAYARLYIETTIGYNTSGQQTLRFSMMNPTSGNAQQFYVALYNTSGSPIHYLQVHNYVSGGSLTANTWYDIIIPISDLQASSQTIGGFVVEIGTSGTFYLDDISFSTSSGSTGSTITSVSVSCSPTSTSTSSTSSCTPTVSGTGSYNSAVTWSASAGSVNSSGVFTAPSSVPSPAGVTITATSVQDTSKYGTATVTVTSSLSQASSDVFTDTMGTGWSIGSWSQVTVDPTSDTSYQGGYGMKAQIATSNYGRVKLMSSSGYKFNTAGKNYLGFAINIGRSETETLYVSLLDSSGTAIHYVTLSPSILPNAYQWKVFFISLTDLYASGIDVYGVEVQSYTPSTFFLDSIKFKGDNCSGL